MINPDDLDPPRPTIQPVNLENMGLDDLRSYIATLEAEIARAEAMIEKKQAHRSGADSLFQKR